MANSDFKIISLKGQKEAKSKNLKPRVLGKKKSAQKKEKARFLVIEKGENKTHIREIAFIVSAGCLVLFVINIINLGFGGIKLKSEIVSSASAGFEKILTGAAELKSSHFDKATELFNEAKVTFDAIQNETWFIQPKFAILSLNDPVFEAGNGLIQTGRNLALAGVEFSAVAKALQILPQSFFKENELAGGHVRASLTEQLKKQVPGITNAANYITIANAEIKRIPNSFVPREIREKFNFAKSALAEVSKIIGDLNSDIPAILTLLGDIEPHTFLVLLQNNAEIRPSGGFIGNYVIVETNDGYVTKNETFDVYNADHQLAEFVTPPPEIANVNNRWFMRDSNYSGDFPLSAQKAAWFLEKENGPGVDTVIAVDLSLIEELLRLTGPISVPQLRRALTNENFSVILSYIVESKLTGRENPKEMLHDFVPVFKKKLFENADPVALASALGAGIESKHLLAYSRDSGVEDFFARHGLAGEMKKLEPKEDYLNIVHSSVGGNKSDRYMEEKIVHDTYIQSDNEVKVDLAITRSHGWHVETEKEITDMIRSFGFKDIPLSVLEILGRSRNLQAVRIYVPKGSVLESSSDNSVKTNFDEETGKTYFSVMINTPVGQSKTLKLRYKLPFKLNLNFADKYQLTVQKQAGQGNITLQKRIAADSGILNYKYFPDGGSFDVDGVWNYENKLEKDMTFTSVWGK